MASVCFFLLLVCCIRHSRNDLRRWRVIRIVGPAKFKQIERAGVWPESPGYDGEYESVGRIRWECQRNMMERRRNTTRVSEKWWEYRKKWWEFRNVWESRREYNEGCQNRMRLPLELSNFLCHSPSYFSNTLHYNPLTCIVFLWRSHRIPPKPYTLLTSMPIISIRKSLVVSFKESRRSCN